MEQIVGGRYRLQERLAVSAAGETWRAIDGVLERTVTVTVLTVSQPHASAFSKVTHPAVVALIDFSADFAVFEYVVGQDISALVKDPEGYLPFRVAASLAYVAEGLQLVHDQGVVHGDIKATDLIVNSEGVLVLTGFSLRGLTGTVRSDLDALTAIVRGCLAGVAGTETFSGRSFASAGDLAAAIRVLFPMPEPPPSYTPAPSTSPAPPQSGSAPVPPVARPPHAPGGPQSAPGAGTMPPPVAAGRARVSGSPPPPSPQPAWDQPTPQQTAPQQGWDQPTPQKLAQQQPAWDQAGPQQPAPEQEEPAPWGGADQQGGWGAAPPDQGWGGAPTEAPAPVTSPAPAHPPQSTGYGQAAGYGQAGGYQQASGPPPAQGNPAAFTVSVGYPKRVAKGRASTFVVQIHAPAGLAAAAQRLSQIFGDTPSNLASTQGMLKLGHDVELSLSSPDVEFSAPTHWTVTETGIDSAFWARPGETARAGDHTGLLTIREGQSQLVSLPFTFTIADYALGKISRPAVRWAGTGVGVALSIAVLAYSQINGVQEVAGIVTSAIGAVVSAVVTERTTALYNRRAGRASTTVAAS